MSSHTPTPWYSMSKADDSQGTVAQEQTGQDVAVTYRGAADAHHIVRCVNEREELLAALESVTHALENWVEIADDEDRRDYDDEALAQAHKLLARAREEGV